MRIEAVKFMHPAKLMTNEDILDEIREHSQDLFDGDLERALSLVAYMLESTGLSTRYWMKDESPLELMCRAAEAAMEEANVRCEDIDLLIFCGIARGFLEPGDSYFVAQALGMDKVDCFDLMDACMAWTRACDVVENFFLSGRYKRAMIVNAESYFIEGGISYPSNFKLKSYRAIEYCFGAFCGGDGAAATILVADEERPWERYYFSTKKGVDYCTIPLPGYEKRCLPSPYIGLNGLGSFTAFGSKVFDSFQYMIDILKKLEHRFEDLKMIFAHTGGDVNAYEKWATSAGAAGKVRYLFPEFGNIGSLSIPASIAYYVDKGELKRGDNVGAWIGSSGMAFSSYAFTY